MVRLPVIGLPWLLRLGFVELVVRFTSGKFDGMALAVYALHADSNSRFCMANGGLALVDGRVWTELGL